MALNVNDDPFREEDFNPDLQRIQQLSDEVMESLETPDILDVSPKMPESFPEADIPTFDPRPYAPPTLESPKTVQLPSPPPPTPPSNALESHFIDSLATTPLPTTWLPLRA